MQNIFEIQNSFMCVISVILKNVFCICIPSTFTNSILYLNTLSLYYAALVTSTSFCILN